MAKNILLRLLKHKSLEFICDETTQKKNPSRNKGHHAQQAFHIYVTQNELLDRYNENEIISCLLYSSDDDTVKPLCVIRSMDQKCVFWFKFDSLQVSSVAGMNYFLLKTDSDPSGSLPCLDTKKIQSYGILVPLVNNVNQQSEYPNNFYSLITSDWRTLDVNASLKYPHDIIDCYRII